ncbi:MAG TPA: sensor histidine kinase [Methylomirabilota bacterium]|nr:sensor histidine kinase [Methylomirabilota bacterium]
MALGDWLRNRWLRWLGVAAFWTLVGLAFAGQLYLSRANVGAPVSWRFAIERALADWYVFALLSIPAFRLARRFHVERATWVRPLAFHVAAGAMFSLGWMALRAAVEQILSASAGQRIGFQEAFSHALVATFSFNVMVYWAVVAVAHAFDYYRKFTERELRAAELERRLSEARLQALQMQLNPHFLFNTLNAIASLMHFDVAAADRMIARLSELLRYTLESTDAQEVSLAQELDFLRRYIEIQQVRFGPRLEVREEIAPEVLAAQVPNLVLQPLVENAVAYGVAPHSRPGCIVLGARRTGDALQLEVRDNGDGLPAGRAFKEGVGLSNTRSRLQQLYGPAHRMELLPAAEGGLAVRITIPWRVKPDA